MHRQGIAKLEIGEREPTWATVRTLAKALGVTCMAFDVEDAAPDATPARSKGRPRKADATASSRKPAAAKRSAAKGKRKE